MLNRTLEEHKRLNFLDETIGAEKRVVFFCVHLFTLCIKKCLYFKIFKLGTVRSQYAGDLKGFTHPQHKRIVFEKQYCLSADF